MQQEKIAQLSLRLTDAESLDTMLSKAGNIEKELYIVTKWD